MFGIIAYGSLINRQEIETLRRRPTAAVPVRLKTFRRSFNQRPVWRDCHSDHAAVLNVQSAKQHWLNAVCYCFDDFDFTALDNRERGYVRTAVPLDRVNLYQGHHLPELEERYIYLGKKQYQDDILLPNPDYLDICLTGAKHWGEEFYRDFLTTTHINNGILLCNYLESF